MRVDRNYSVTRWRNMEKEDMAYEKVEWNEKKYNGYDGNRNTVCVYKQCTEE